jgi:hypothetical protein
MGGGGREESVEIELPTSPKKRGWIAKRRSKKLGVLRLL